MVVRLVGRVEAVPTALITGVSRGLWRRHRSRALAPTHDLLLGAAVARIDALATLPFDGAATFDVELTTTRWPPRPRPLHHTCWCTTRVSRTFELIADTPSKSGSTSQR